MARVTVEDCVLQVPNRFDLVMLAAQRARDIASGAELTIERDRVIGGENGRLLQVEVEL